MIFQKQGLDSDRQRSWYCMVARLSIVSCFLLTIAIFCFTVSTVSLWCIEGIHQTGRPADVCFRRRCTTQASAVSAPVYRSGRTEDQLVRRSAMKHTRALRSLPETLETYRYIYGEPQHSGTKKNRCSSRHNLGFMGAVGFPYLWAAPRGSWGRRAPSWYAACRSLNRRCCRWSGPSRFRQSTAR